MRRLDRAVTEQSAIDDVMDRAQLCRIGLVDKDGPYVVPVCFGFQGRSLFFHGASEGRKIDAIRLDPRVCFEATVDQELVVAENACGFTMRFCCVMGSGIAVMLADHGERRAGFDCIMRKYSKGSSFAYDAAILARTTVVRVDIKELSMKVHA